MLRHAPATAKARQLLLLDFLVPSLIQRTRPYSTRPKTNHAVKPRFPLQASPSIISSMFLKLRANVPALNSSFPGQILPPDKVRLFNETIANIRTSLESNKRDELLKHWQTLDELKLIHLLGNAQLVPLSHLMLNSLAVPGQTAEHEETRQLAIDPSMKKLVENIALVAAKKGTFHALNSLMRHYIAEEDPQAILELYNKFMSLIGDADLTVEHKHNMESGTSKDEEEAMRDVLATDKELKFSRTPLVAGRVHLLMAAVTAHAMRDSFKDALDLCLSTVVQLEISCCADFLRVALGDNPTLKSKLKKYLVRLRTAKLVSRPGVFSSQVSQMGNSRLTMELEKLYKHLVEGLSGDDAYLAADPSLVTDKKTVALTTVGWTTLLTAFLKCEKKDLAGRLWDDMKRFGVPPGVSMWTALIDSYEQIRAVDDALAAWNLMLKQGVEPDGLAYRAIISALFKGRRPREAMEMFSKYKALPVKKSDDHQLSVWNTVLHGLCASNCTPEAEALREEMEKTGPKPDRITFNTFINYYGRRRQFKGVAATLRAMKKAGEEGDVFTYTTILSALLKAGKLDAAELVLALMDKQGVKRNVALYSALIDHQLREGGERNFQAAMKMLEMMENDRRNPPNEITYTSILSGLYRLHWMDPDERAKWEMNIMGRIRSRGLSFGLPTYHLLIKACLLHPHENAVPRALAYFEEMKKREIPIINTTWYILLAGLLGRGEWGTADKLVAEMYASGIHPTGSLLRLVYRIKDRA